MDRLGDNSVVVCYLATVSPGLVNLEKNKKPLSFLVHKRTQDVIS